MLMMMSEFPTVIKSKVMLYMLQEVWTIHPITIVVSSILTEYPTLLALN